MRFPPLIPALCLAALIMSCSEGGLRPVETPQSGTVVVYVYWDGQGLSGYRVELVELGVEMTTNDDGLAEFVVSPGAYTLRAYGINEGGPGAPYIDMDVTVDSDDTTRVEIMSCLPCV